MTSTRDIKEEAFVRKGTIFITMVEVVITAIVMVMVIATEMRD